MFLWHSRKQSRDERTSSGRHFGTRATSTPALWRQQAPPAQHANAQTQHASAGAQPALAAARGKQMLPPQVLPPQSTLMTLLAARTAQPLVKAQVVRQVHRCHRHQQQAQQHLIHSQVRQVPSQLAVSVQDSLACSKCHMSRSGSCYTEALTQLPGISASVACCVAQLHRTLPSRNQLTEAAALPMPTHGLLWCKLVDKHGSDELLCWRIPKQPVVGITAAQGHLHGFESRRCMALVLGQLLKCTQLSASDNTWQCIWPVNITSWRAASNILW